MSTQRMFVIKIHKTTTQSYIIEGANSPEEAKDMLFSQPYKAEGPAISHSETYTAKEVHPDADDA